jgi:hypothetical protein
VNTQVKVSNEGRGNWVVGLFDAPNGDEVEFCTSRKEAMSVARYWSREHNAPITDESMKANGD